MNDFMDNVKKSIKDYENYKVDMKKLAEYLGEDESVIDEVQDVILDLPAIVDTASYYGRIHTEMNEYLGDNYFVMFEYIGEDVNDAADSLRTVTIYQDFEDWKAGKNTNHDWEDSDIKDEVQKVLDGEIELCDLSFFSELHELYTSYECSNYFDNAYAVCIDEILRAKSKVRWIVKNCLEELIG